jgi:hypothetical protein
LAFGLAPHAGGSEEVATASEVLQEQIAGFYDSDSDSVFVRHAKFASLEDEAKHLAVVAHEVHHALQYQHFDMKALRKTDSDDQALARLALIEGDAMVAMGAYLGARYGMPIRQTARSHRRGLGIHRRCPGRSDLQRQP